MSKKTQFFQYLLLLIAGAASVFSFAPYRLFWLMPLCLIVLIILVARHEKHCFLYAWIWGVAAYSANTYWIYYSLHDVAGLNSALSVLLVLFLPAILACYPALALSLTLRLTRNKNINQMRNATLRWAIVFPACWTLFEWLRSWSFTGLSWAEIGYSQIIESPLAGFAPLLGIHGVSLVVAFFAGSLFLFIQSLYKPASLNLKANFYILFLMLFCLALGAWSQRHEWVKPAGAPIRVALAQGNIAQSLKWSAAAFDSTLQLYLRQVAQTKADLMILPEAALPAFLGELPKNYLPQLKQKAQAKHMALALGVPIMENGRQVNALLNVSSANQAYYAKQHLVPFGEYIPLPVLSTWLYSHMNMPMTGFSADVRHADVLSMAGQKIAFNICYEDGFSSDILPLARRSSILANVSNLAWFGKSNAMYQQLQHSQARALENGRYMLRSTNTGVTAIVDQHGRIKQQAKANFALVLTGFAQGYQGWTPFMYVGNYLIVLLSLLLLLCGYMKNRRLVRYR